MLINYYDHDNNYFECDQYLELSLVELCYPILHPLPLIKLELNDTQTEQNLEIQMTLGETKNLIQLLQE